MLQRKTFHSSAPSSSSSCAENVDPNRTEYTHFVNGYLDKINANLSSADKVDFMHINFVIILKNTVEFVLKLSLRI